MGKSIFTHITEKTLYGARDRVLEYLNILTHGEADKAIEYVQEYLELDSICEEYKKQEKELAEKLEKDQKPYIP